MPCFFKGGHKFDPLLQIVVDTVAIHPPLETPFVGAAHPHPPLQMAPIFRGGWWGEPPLQMVFLRAGELLQYRGPFVATG